MKRFAPGLVVSLLVAGCASTPPPVAPPVTVVVPQPAPPASQAAPPAEPVAPARSESDAVVPILPTDPTWGSRTAPVTIVFFGDFQCPFTARATKTIRALEDKYGEAGLRVVWKNDPLPFHPHARETAEAAEAVQMLGGSAAFWSFYESAFANQSQLGAAAFDAWAQAAGVNPASFDPLVQAHAGAAKVDSDLALGKRVGVNGTPDFFINGVALNGAQPEDKFVVIVEAQLEKARKLAEGGTAPEDVYATLAKENFAQPPAPTTASDTRVPDTTTVWNVPLGSAPARGSDAALVTIVEFADFQCPFCKRVEPTLEKIRSTYGDKVRLVWRDQPLPFHARALAAAELAREARAEKGVAGFWAVHDALFASQPKLEDPDLDAIAAAAGLNATRAHDAVARATHKAAIQEDQDLADGLPASGTPSFFLNGRSLTGAQPFEKFQAIIDEEITHAKAVLAKGTRPASLYETLVRTGRSAPPPETRHVAPATNAPTKGSASAKVVIQEFADFQCPFCKRAEDTLRDVLQENGANVRLVWRDLPLPMHPNAELAAEAAREAQRQKGNDGFWKMHDKLFAGQTAPGLDRPALDGYAKELGLDMAAFDDALDQRTMDATVHADAQAARDARVSGTPAFFIGSYYLNGAQAAPKFRSAIAFALKDSAPRAVLAGAALAPGGGLSVTDLVVGKGDAAKNGDKITVHYVGTLQDGTEFDSSRKRGRPFSFTLGGGQVIKGWDQGLVGMRVGGRRKLVIPAALAYGERAMGSIPANSNLVFDVELLSIP